MFIDVYVATSLVNKDEYNHVCLILPLVGA